MDHRQRLIARDRADHLAAITVERIASIRAAVIDTLADHPDLDADDMRVLLADVAQALDGERQLLALLTQAATDLGARTLPVAA